MLEAEQLCSSYGWVVAVALLDESGWLLVARGRFAQVLRLRDGVAL